MYKLENVCNFFEKALVNMNDSKNYITYNAVGTFPFQGDNVQKYLEEFLEKNKLLIRITRCEVFHTDAKEEYDKSIAVIRRIPGWHPVRWIASLLCKIGYCGDVVFPPYWINIEFERSNGFLPSLEQLNNEDGKFSSYN